MRSNARAWPLAAAAKVSRPPLIITAPRSSSPQRKHPFSFPPKYKKTHTCRPPGVYAYNASAAKLALSLEARGVLSRGFWAHGLWPSSWRQRRGANANGTASRGSWCEESGAAGAGTTARQLTEADLGRDLATALTYWMPNPTRTNFSAKENLDWWSREWSKHGSCSGLTPRAYFSLVVEQATRANPGVVTALAAAGITPSNDRTYSAAAALAALRRAYGGAVDARGGLVCATDNQARVVLQEVELCLDAASLAPCDCHSGCARVSLFVCV